ncbi:FAD-dependent monooxygenase [Psychromicrobium xiongbiense]|uniref:FAD-dependent monooxygenase n=1 Tax=Psychromicrobium xiongbiense TaxID=3051184 RepID=UPI002556B8E3|nr:FAD-dependent monooxygenase [Psychromicrobium sp. YIM S02556]
MPPERVNTVVIGSGLSGLAVASELSRQGIDSVVIDSTELFGPDLGTRSPSGLGLAETAHLAERNEVMRVLRHYARSHGMDVRSQAKATAVSLSAPSTGAQWIVQTSEGIITADTLVLTRCAQVHLRRLFASLGLAVGQDLASAIRAMGLYFVEVGDSLTLSTRQILREAKNVGEAISARYQATHLATA